jgi:hypothetical protein
MKFTWSCKKSSIDHYLSRGESDVKYWSTPKRGVRVITKALLNEARETGVYCDEEGDPMLASELVRDPKFTARVVAETRALLSTIPK